MAENVKIYLQGFIKSVDVWEVCEAGSQVSERRIGSRNKHICGGFIYCYIKKNVLLSDERWEWESLSGQSRLIGLIGKKWLWQLSGSVPNILNFHFWLNYLNKSRLI